MREIKFRAWDGNKKEMVEDAVSVAIIVGNSCIDQTTGTEIHVMQYTGLKDKNGVEIYEGDIAVWYVNDVQRTGEIYYTGQSFDMRNDVTGYGYIGWDALRGEIEVIGNIYENPELLETS